MVDVIGAHQLARYRTEHARVQPMQPMQLSCDREGGGRRMVPGDLNEQREGATLGVAPRCPTQSQLQREVIGLRRIAEHCLGFAHGVRKCAVEHQALHRRCICLL